MTTANRYNVQSPGCDHYYVDATIEGIARLIHPGYKWGDKAPTLPTSRCIPSYDYVRFEECKHCCPQTFGTCPDCFNGSPTDKRCSR